MKIKENYDQITGIPRFALWKKAVCEYNKLDENSPEVTMQLVVAYESYSDAEIKETILDFEEEIGYDPDILKPYYQTYPSFSSN
jgi:hypothetical protein